MAVATEIMNVIAMLVIIAGLGIFLNSRNTVPAIKATGDFFVQSIQAATGTIR